MKRVSKFVIGDHLLKEEEKYEEKYLLPHRLNYLNHLNNLSPLKHLYGLYLLWWEEVMASLANNHF